MNSRQTEIVTQKIHTHARTHTHTHTIAIRYKCCKPVRQSQMVHQHTVKHYSLIRHDREIDETWLKNGK